MISIECEVARVTCTTVVCDENGLNTSIRIYRRAREGSLDRFSFSRFHENFRRVQDSGALNMLRRRTRPGISGCGLRPGHFLLK